MKKIIIAAGLLLLNVLNSTAGNGNKISDIISKHFTKTIIKNEFFSQSEKTQVVFQIDANGKANILLVDTKNTTLKQNIKTQFESVDFSNANYLPNEKYIVELHFKNI
jgi:hypothetical protein